MSLRPLVPIAALSLLAVAVPATAGATSPLPPQAKCLPKGAKSLAVSPTARVYRAAAKNGGTAVVGCYRPTGRIARLAREFDEVETSREVVAVKISDRYAAYVVEDIDQSCKDACPPGFDSQRDVVRVADVKAGTSRAVSGGNADPKSLKIVGSTVRWTENGTAKSAPLSASAKTANCRPRGSKTVTTTSTIRVYSLADKDAGDDLVGSVHACRIADDVDVTLADEYDDDYVSSTSVGSVLITGTHVLYVVTSTDVSCKADCPPDYDPSSSTLSSYDFATTKSAQLSAGDVDAGSVRVTGSTVSWTEKGVAKSAKLD